MKLKLVGALLILSALGLTGCGASSGGGNGAPDAAEDDSKPLFLITDTFVQDLPDGREVVCVWVKEGYGGGVSCDWDNAE